MSNKILPGRKKVRFCLGFENNFEELVFNFQNMYYLSNSLCNLVSLRLLNNSRIYYNNILETLYHIKSKKILVKIQR